MLFSYNDQGDRVTVEVVGQGVTTYTLDLAAGSRILAEETLTGTTLYLYGLDCLGELRDDEWLYYLPDAEGLVRQGADADGDVTGAWLFDPEGVVLEGPQGPVSHLVCGGVYDGATGLIYKDGRYFDPLLGIWLALLPLVVVQYWRGRKGKRRGWPWMVLVALCLVGVSGTLTGCGPGGGTSSPAAICTETPTPTPEPVTFSINFTFVEGSTFTDADAVAHLAEANTILNPYQIILAENTSGRKILTHDESLVIDDNDDFAYDHASDGPGLLGINRENAHVTVYYVREIRWAAGTLEGYGYPPGNLIGAGGNRGYFGAILANGATGYTLAHEFVHTCGVDHVNIETEDFSGVPEAKWEDNLMTRTGSGRELSDKQVARIKSMYTTLLNTKPWQPQ